MKKNIDLTWIAHNVVIALYAILFFVDSDAECQITSDKNKSAIIITSTKTFSWNSGAQGWMATNDFILDSVFTKLAGPVDGNAWVTENPLNPQTYTEGAHADSQGYPSKYPGPNLLISPWFNLSKFHDTSVYVSFQQSLAVEAGWDGSWMEYTTDGTHWKHLGKLNDPNGVNWYSTGTYKNALTQTGEPPDTATLRFPQYKLYGPGTSITGLPFSWWTSNGIPSGNGRRLSNGEGRPEGPFGWIYCQLRITSSEYPDIFNARFVQFRYVAFSDAVNPPYPFEGWAVDNFTIGRK